MLKFKEPRGDHKVQANGLHPAITHNHMLISTLYTVHVHIVHAINSSGLTLGVLTAVLSS